MTDKQDNEKKIKNQFEVLKRIDTYIGTTNTKCTIIMSYCAAAIAFIITFMAKISIENTSSHAMCIIVDFSILALALALICMVLATLTIFPLTFSQPGTSKGQSLIFYGDIASCATGKEYSEKVISFTDDEFLADLNAQVYTLAFIVSRKFSKIKFLSVVLMIHFGCMASFIIGAIAYYLF